ncbi:MAG: amidohydrolase, partial [Streptomycetaceae bacterium]|nr:amidohydrolase [Streptomycetaceae bacterium]
GVVPEVVFSYDVHSMWLNSAGMRRLGVTAGELPFGVADADGFVTEFAVRGLSRDGQRALAERGLPWAGEERRYRRLLSSLDKATGYGITTVVEPQNSVDDLPLFERALAEGRMRSRVIAALFHPRGTTDLAAFAAAARQDPWLSVGPLKLYIDDVVEPRTAALLEPYCGHAHSGGTFYPPREFADLLAKLDAAGFQAFVHATGDRGVRTALDAIEHARAVNGPRDARHQIVHVECLDPADVPRFAELGVVACMQPRHCSPDIAGPGHDWAANLGRERWSKAWPMRSLEEAGAVLAFSSDWNVAEMDPMVGIYTAVTRKGLAGGPAWVPEETVSLAAAVRAYTMGSAYANFREHDRGSITPGKLADFAIFSDNLFEIPVEGIPGVRAETVIMDGVVR